MNQLIKSIVLSIKFFFSWGFAFAVINVYVVTPSFAQHSPGAQEDFKKAKKAIEKKDMNKALELYLSAINFEFDDPNPDHQFLGKILEELGSFYSSPGYYAYSARYYTFSAIQYHKAGDFEKAKSSFSLASSTSDSIIKTDEAFKQEVTDGEYVSVDFSVRKVLNVKGDTTWVELNAGLNEGISPNQLGWMVTRHETNSERGNNVYGRCGVLNVFNTYCTAWIAASKEAKDLNLKVIENDNVQLNVKLSKSTYKGLLYELAKLNIYFNDDYKKPIIDFTQISNFNKASSEDAVIGVMRHIIQGTAIYLYDSTDYDPVQYPKLSGGMFEGRNMWEAMLYCTDNDIRAFLRFVISFPAKYMGHHYRIDETFATWVINNTPMATEESENLTKGLMKLNSPQQKDSFIKVNFNIIRIAGLNHETIQDRIFELMGDSNYTAVNDEVTRMMNLTNMLKNDSLHLVYKLMIGQNLAAQEKYDQAIKVYQSVLEVDTANGNAHWYLGHAYLRNDEFKRALAEYDIIKTDYPFFAGGHAMYGWTLIKSGRFPQAFEHCKAGYDLDSSNASYIMNLGHAYLLTNEPGKARYYYIRALENIETVDNFDNGLMEDFRIFLKNYWQTDLVKKERDFLTNEWNNHYRNKVLADEYYEKGKKLEKKEEYAKAGAAFDEAIKYEKSGAIVRYDWLRSYHRWSAYQYYKNEDFDEALTRYKQAWEINRNYINDIENEVSDLTSIGNMYSWLDNDLQKDMYRKMQQAAQYKLQTQTRSNHLYVISIGRDKYGNFGYNHAESDAKNIAETLKAQGRLVFDQTEVSLFNSANSSLASIQKAFENVISNSRPGDCFVLYYSGYCSKNANGEMIFGSDTITNEQLLGWLRLMQADKKLILLDAANTSLINSYTRGKQAEDDAYNHENLTFILSDGRIELPQDSAGLFTSYLVKGLRGEAAVNWGSTYQIESVKGLSSLAYISAKGLEGYMYGKMNKGNLQFELKSYSQGADFPISFTTGNTFSGSDTVPPMIYITGATSGDGHRGGQSKSVSAKGKIYGQALDASGIQEILVNGVKVNFSQNGKFELGEDFIKRWTKIVISAKDKNGIVGVDSFFLNTAPGEGSPQSQAGENNVEGTNYALLFATNQYDNWSQLANPINDAQAIADILEREYGFQVKIVENLTRQEMRNTLLEYFAKNYTPKDQLFVFFAGHGIHNTYLGGQIVCKDSKKSSEDPTFDSYLSFEWVKSSLNNVYRCQHILLTLDVCYGGAGFNQKNAIYYGNSTEDIKKDPQGFYDQRLKYKTRLYLTSGDSTYVSDGKGQHSPFATKFISTLNSKGAEKGGIITLTDFANNMRFVEQGRQEIRYGSFGDSHIEGDFVFMYRGDALKKNSATISAGGFVSSKP